MSIQAMSAAWQHSKQNSTTLFVLVAIADYADENGICWPSIPTLAKKCRMSRRSVQRCISKLVSSGELARLSTGTGRESSRYQVTIEGCQFDTPVTSVTPGVSPVSPKPSGNHQSTSNPPGLFGEREHEERMLAKCRQARPESEQAVIAFCRGLGLPQSDAEYFWNHWVANGFKNNKAAMHDWKATIRSWKLAGHCPSQKQSQRKPWQRELDPRFFDKSGRRKSAADQKLDDEYEEMQRLLALQRKKGKP